MIDLLLAAVAGKGQREDVGHEAGLGEEDDEHFDSMAERCPFNFSLRCPFSKVIIISTREHF